MPRTLAFATMLVPAPPAYGQDWQKGLDAYNSCDGATALRVWRPLAKAGDAEAQGKHGRMHHLGQRLAREWQEVHR